MAKKATKNTGKNTKEKAGLSQTEAVSSLQSPGTNAEATEGIQPTQEKKMTLSFKGLDKSGRNAVYTGAAISLRFPIGAFPDKKAPSTLGVDGLAGPKEARVKETKEERKARLAAAPKPTLAEKLAKAEARTAAIREKLAASQTAVEQPAM